METPHPALPEFSPSVGSYQQHQPPWRPTLHETDEILADNIKLIPSSRAASAKSSPGARRQPSQEMLVPVARTPGGTGAAPSPKPGTRGRDRIGVLICAGAAPRWGPWCWLLSCPQLGSCTSWDISRASWSRYAQGPEGQRPSGHEQAKQRCRGRGALPAGPRSPRDAGSIWDHSARWKPGCASRAAKGCLGASLCPHPQLLPPPAGFARAWLPAPSQCKGPNSPQIHPQE